MTKLPAHLEQKTPLAFASPDAIAFAVAAALQRRAKPRRVVHWTGEPPDIRANVYAGAHKISEGDGDLYAEYVPPGPVGSDYAGTA